MLKAFALTVVAATLSTAAPSSASTLPNVEVIVFDRNAWTNTTVWGTIGALITDPSLERVSELYVSSAAGVPVETVTCTPYRFIDGTGAGALPFQEGNPSRLSTNTVVVGSIYCSSSQFTCAA